MPALAFEIQHGIDHMLDDARPRNLPVLRDMPHQNDRHAALLGKGHDLMRRRPDLRDRSRRGFHRIQPHGLNAVDHRQTGPFRIQRRQNVAQIGLGPQAHCRPRQTQPLRAHLHLRDRLLAREIQRLQPRPGKRRRGLQQECRFSDPRIAADQNRRGRNQAAPQNPIKLRQPRSHTRRRRRHRGQIGQRHRPPLGQRQLRADRQRRFFDNRIPRPARLAAPRPFGIGCATGGAGEGKSGFCHGSVMQLNVRKDKVGCVLARTARSAPTAALPPRKPAPCSAPRSL